MVRDNYVIINVHVPACAQVLLMCNGNILPELPLPLGVAWLTIREQHKAYMHTEFRKG